MKNKKTALLDTSGFRFTLTQSSLGVMLALGMTAAQAAAGSPGIPTDNPPIFKEDFENPQTAPAAGQALSLGEYKSATLDVNGDPLQYTAAGVAYTGTPAIAAIARPDPPNVPFWLNKNFCNGMWLDSTKVAPTGALLAAEYDPNGTGNTDGYDLAYCMGGFGGKLNNAWGQLQRLAKSLGVLVNGGTEAANAGNHVIAAYTVTRTNRDTPMKPLVQLQMTQPIPIPAGGRFITFSVAMATTSCKYTAGGAHSPVDANIDFYLIHDVTGDKTDLSTGNANLTKLNSQSANPCPATAPASGVISGAQIYGDKPVLYTRDRVAMQFVNNSSGTNGNDGAFDNLKILDLTPQLDKSFADAQLANGKTTTLTFTITNTTELAQKTGWTFTDTLPTGMTVASAPTTNCGASTTANATLGGNKISVTAGDLPANTASCTVSLDVKVSAPAPMNASQTLTNGPLGSGTAGTPGTTETFALNPPGTAQVTVLPAVDLIGTGTTSQSVSKGTPVTFHTSCTNDGPDMALGATCAVTGIPTDATGVSTSCAPSPTDLAPNSVISCTTSFVPVTPGVVTLTTTAATTGSLDTNPSNDAAPTLLYVRPLADMQVSTPTTITTTVGTPVKVTSTCTNAGPDVAEAADCKVTGAPTGATTICTPTPPVTALAVGTGVISCETTFTPTTPGTVTLVTTATSTTTDPDPSNNVGQTPVITTPPMADMQASSPPGLMSTPGVEATLVSTCTNAGPSVADNATCTVTGAPTGATTICTPASPVTSLAVGASITCETKFTPKDAAIVTITTTAGSTTTDPVPTNNVAKTLTPAASDPAAVPTLGEWALWLLSALLGGFALMGVRRQRQQS
ncbi:IPTL-CTERM sorting domain-containing protein [Diaphorobacter sp. HDW4B]|uniref:IPTL-CTERM sorting domain-containing protein n=1 Tax=Diaphorobacter sp. HDW4B TaxID=2714925 RepID=UPI00140C028B|nr:IPTL-CTERM sorting domain-containing protein [Diaphorobacter sp. HDW4B]QIL72539.1 IPTL-CTERM sorting domain-containing protein [Diaphorobacter sp. HDW4B]